MTHGGRTQGYPSCVFGPSHVVLKGQNRYLSTTVPPFPYDRLLLAVHIVRLDNEDNMETSREEIPADGEAGALVHRLPEQ
jgi:hypothetical protein